MPDSSEQGALEVQAFIHRVRPFVVFLAPVGQAPEHSSGAVGTGFLVQFRRHKYLISALHNFFFKESRLPGVIQSWESSRFKFPDPQPVNFEDVFGTRISRRPYPLKFAHDFHQSPEFVIVGRLGAVKSKVKSIANFSFEAPKSLKSA